MIRKGNECSDARRCGLTTCPTCGEAARAAIAGKAPAASRRPCIHLGLQTGERECAGCGPGRRPKAFACAVFSECTIGKKLDGLACCAGCEKYQAPK